MSRREVVTCPEITARTKRLQAKADFNEYLKDASQKYSIFLSAIDLTLIHSSFQISYAFKHKLRKWVPRIPAYTTLAPELLFMIAEHVARVGSHEKEEQKVSKDLLRMRLVCKQFSEIATTTFLSLIQTDHYDDYYTTLNLPPKSGSLDHVMSALSPKGSMSSIVTNVKYHVVRSPVQQVHHDEWLYEWVSEV